MIDTVGTASVSCIHEYCYLRIQCGQMITVQMSGQIGRAEVQKPFTGQHLRQSFLFKTLVSLVLRSRLDPAASSRAAPSWTHSCVFPYLDRILDSAGFRQLDSRVMELSRESRQVNVHRREFPSTDDLVLQDGFFAHARELPP